jgi:hypothetical protein
MTYRQYIAAAAFLGAALAATATVAQAPGTLAPRDCFQASRWDGWSSPAPGVIYIKVGNNDIYRVDLVDARRSLHKNGRFLVFEPRGSSLVCGPIDLDISLADTSGYDVPLFPKSLVKLTDEEIAAIPRSHRPS